MNSSFLHRAVLTAVACVVWGPPASAEPMAIEDAQRLHDAAEAAVREAAGSAATGLVAVVDTPDARLRLPRCPGPLQAQISGDGQLREHTAIAVRCQTAIRWLVYLGATLAVDLPVLVARHPLPREAVPVPADFTVLTRRVPGTSSRYVGDPAQLDGKRLRRALDTGEALGVDALVAAPVVRRGQQVTLLAQGGGMQVRATVVALMDGCPDERIRVQNAGSQRVVEAIVRSAGLVEAAL